MVQSPFDARISVVAATAIRILRYGRTLHTWSADEYSVFAVAGGVLYRVGTSYSDPDCMVVAVDLSRGRILWHAPLRGLGPQITSRYWHRVNIVATGNLVTVYDESWRSYIEGLDAKTGRRMAHHLL